MNKNLIALLTPMLFWVTSADAENPSLGAASQFNIPKQRADVALTEFARQSNMTVIVPYDKVVGIETAELKGRYPLVDAAISLLEGTSLKLSFSNSGQLFIRTDDDVKGNHSMLQKNKLSSAILLALSSLAGAQATAQDAASAPMLEEVLVTAQKREQSAQDTPIAMTAVSSESLDDNNISDVSGLVDVVPTMEINQSGTGNQLSMRGVSSNNYTEFGDQAVTLHMNGVAVPRAEAINALFQDIERVEVLRGPQGTLFGRNSTAGTVNIITKKPTDELEGKIGASVGNYGSFGVTGVANIPVNESWALRASLFTNSHDAYAESSDDSIPDDGQPYTGDLKSGRISSRFTPTDDIEWNVSLDIINDKGNRGVPVSPQTDDPRVVDLREPMSMDQTMTLFNSHFKMHLTDSWAFSYLYGQNDTDMDARSGGSFVGDTAYAPTIWSINHQVKSHELQMEFDSDWLQGVFGLYKFEEFNDPLMLSLVRSEDYLHFIQPNVGANSDAIFAQGTYSLTHSTRVTLGARYTEDEKYNRGGWRLSCDLSVDQRSDLSPDTEGCSGLGAASSFDGEDSWDQTTYRLVVEQDTANGNMLYGNISTGYKAGNHAAQNIRPAYGPENLINYELGGKFDLLDSRLRLNAALYRMDYDDLQVNQVVPDPFWQGAPNDPERPNANVTINAAAATVQGAELEYTWLPNQNGVLQGYIAFLSAEYDEFPNVLIPENNAAGLQDLSGKKLPKAPEFSFNAAYSHDIYMSSGSIWRPRIAVTFKDDHYLREFNLPVDRVSAYTTVDASLRYTPSADNWMVELYGKNLTDEAVVSSITGTGTSERHYFYSAPRTYGLRAEYRF